MGAALARKRVSRRLKESYFGLGLESFEPKSVQTRGSMVTVMSQPHEEKANSRRLERTSSVRFLHHAYSLTAVLLRLKNAPALRAASVIAAMFLLAATFLASDHVLEASLVWGSLLVVVNLFQLFLILWDLRPVTLHGEDKILYDRIYSNLGVSSFKRLMGIAERYDGAPGDLLASQGSPVTDIIVLIDGSAEVERDGEWLGVLTQGAIIGEIGSLSARPFSSTIRLAEHSRYIAWKKDLLDHFFACHPSIASGFERAFISRLDPTSNIRNRRELVARSRPTRSAD